MDQKKKKPTDPQIIVILRAVGGGYLLYLAWDLREAALSGENLIYLLCMAVFALAGAALLFFSLRQLYRRDFLYPWQSPDPDGEDEEEDGP